MDDRMASVLNNLGSTAIYVIRQDTHEILYLNDRMKQVMPSAGPGDICQELWTESCDACPLDAMDGKDSHSTVSYNRFFGCKVDLAASRLSWGKRKIPSYLIAITPHIDLMNQTERQQTAASDVLAENGLEAGDLTGRERRLQKRERMIRTALDTVIERAFDDVLYVNLTRDELLLLKSNDAYRTPADLKRPDFNENLIETIHPNWRDEFRDAFERRQLIAAFEQGQERVYREGMRMGFDGQYHWISLEAVRLEDNADGDKMAMILMSTIDGWKRLEQESRLLAASVMAMFGELIVLDLKTGTYLTHKADASTMSVLSQGHQTDFTSYIRRYGQELIHPEDRPRFFNFYRVSRIRQHIEEGKRRFSIEVRRKNGSGAYRWCEMIGMLAENNFQKDYHFILTFRDIHELRMARQEKQDADRRFVMAVNRFFDGIYEYELYSDKVYIWKRAAQINRSQSGLRREELIEIFESGQTTLSMEDSLSCKDGTKRLFAVQVQLMERTREELNIMIYIRDVDDARREEARKQEILKDALSLAEQSSRAKSEFLSRMSHDIRTPMNAIIGMTSIASVNLTNPDRIRECLAKIDISAKFLLSLINDVLDMSRIESGKMNIVQQPFDLHGMIREVATICSHQAEQKKQRFTCRIGDQVEQEYIGDALRLKQILMNLLGNAEKFTPEDGSILLDVERVPQGAESVDRGDADYLKFRVKDDGLGMSREFQAHIFEPFEQEHKGGGRVFEGSGLGLSISRNLVHLMNGQITVTSGPGEGSEFTVLLPLKRRTVQLCSGKEAKDSTEWEGPDEEPSGDWDLQGLRILLVEDNELNQEIARSLLEMEGMAVETADDGQAAVERFQEAAPGHYQAVLMDIRMPVMDGLEATERIRQMDRPDAKTVPIIALTANAFQEEQQEAVRAGISAYLIKPIEPDRLYAMLHEMVGKP